MTRSTCFLVSLALTSAIGGLASRAPLTAQAPANAKTPPQARTFLEETIRPAYDQLRVTFDAEDPGRGLDHFKNAVASQPMTCGLVLSAESLRHRRLKDADSARRVRLATQWLLRNSDADGDGKPGWGLPQSWDAFADGSENPPNTAYTITTAIVLDGLLDALELPDFWTQDQAEPIQRLVRDVILYWCQELWVEGFTGGFFRYSTQPTDATFSVNAPAMFLSPLTRFLKHHPSRFTDDQRQLVEKRTHALAKAIVHTVAPRNGLPFWAYIPMPNPYNRKGPNDLVHHAYILWGIEAYRDYAPTVTLTWTRQQALQSFDLFFRDGALQFFAEGEPDITPQQVKLAPNLWSTGMALAFVAKYGDAERTERFVKELLRQHGPLPRLRHSRLETRDNPPYYPRHAAHALLGLAYAAYTP